MSKLILQAHSVQFSWQDHIVLRNFSLEVGYGEVVCLMGINGCGKSTFLDCVLGEHAPAEGTITVQGIDTLQMKAHARARLLSYVPQLHDRTFPYTVEHVVLMGRTAHQSGLGVPDDDDRTLAHDALTLCGIKHLAQRSCTSLSGGEMQMTLLARALVQDTPLIVLDEPTAHLDFKNELLFLETIEELVKTKEVSVLMATHAPNQVFHLAAAGLDVKVALMAQGKVAEIGSPEDTLNPQNLEEYFDVRACMMFPGSCNSVVRSAEDTALLQDLRQIVPVRVVKNKEEGNQ